MLKGGKVENTSVLDLLRPNSKGGRGQKTEAAGTGRGRGFLKSVKTIKKALSQQKRGKEG